MRGSKRLPSGQGKGNNTKEGKTWVYTIGIE